MIDLTLRLLLPRSTYARLLAPPDRDGLPKRYPREPLRSFRDRQIDAVVIAGGVGTQ